jgi:ABC-type transporter Mla subunit MlaD
MYGLGLFGVAFAILLVYIGFTAPDRIPGRGYYTLKAQFANADNIAKHGQVRLDGKLVGQVLNLRVEHGLATIDLQIDPKYRPLKSDTHVEVRPRSPVGVRYVDITAGKHGTPLPDDALIPARQTRATVQLDEVLGTFDADTRVRTRQFLGGLGGGFAGRGGDLNDALGAAPGFLGDTERVLAAIAAHGDVFGSLIRGSDDAATAAEPVRRQIGEGFTPEARALRPYSEEAGDVHATLEQAPPALSAARRQLPAVHGFVTQLAGFAHNVRPVLAAAPLAFGQTGALLTESRPGLRAATATLKTVGRAVNPTLMLFDRVRPVLPNVDAALQAASPLVATLGAYNCDIKRMGDFWHSGLQYGNAQGNALHFDLNTPGIEGFYGINTDALDGLTGALNNANPNPGCVAGSEYGTRGR